MKREVEIKECLANGTILTIHFRGKEIPRDLLHALNPEHRGMGWHEKHIYIDSPSLKTKEEAKKWVEDVTNEVLTAIERSKQRQSEFRGLLGEKEV